MDSALTSEGENQAYLLSKYLKDQDFNCDLIYSSPLERSMHTARIVTSYMQKEIIEFTKKLMDKQENLAHTALYDARKQAECFYKIKNMKI